MKETPVVLHIDSTDDPTHGNQQLSFFHGYYDQHMFHPLVIFDAFSGQLLSALLRPTPKQQRAFDLLQTISL